MAAPPAAARGPRALVANYGRGVLMGGADVIPGVSGGTVALILGIYERLIGSIRAAAGGPVALLRGDRAGARSKLRAVEWGLVLPLALGIVTALGVGAAIIPGLLERYPVQCRAVFFGLIAGSLPIPWRRIARVGARELAIAALAAVAAFVLVSLPAREGIADPALPVVFASAAVAICAMILPGVSGAFLLLVLGMYEVTLEAVSALDVVYIAVFVLGAVIGLGLFSKLLAFLLEHREDQTMAALVGLMAGSLRALWPWQAEDRGLLAPPAEAGTLVVVALAALGVVAVLALTRAGLATDQDPTT